MIEVIAALIRWLALASNMILIGGCVFLAIAGRERVAFDNPWFARLKRTLPWFAITLLLGLLGLLAITTAQVTGNVESAWNPGAWLELLLAAALYTRFSSRASWQYVLCAFLAALTLAVGSLASHSAAEDLSLLSVLPYMFHIVLASVWAGGLPAFLTLLYATTGEQSDRKADRFGIQTLKRFSVMALPVMITVIVTGVIVTDRMVDTSYAALAATSYGWFLNTKLTLLLVILIIAARAHFVWIPVLGRNGDVADAGERGLRRWVTVEAVLASALVLAATFLASAVPAKHAVIEDWPYPFRFSLDATWGEFSVVVRVGIGITLLLLAGGAIVLGRYKRWGTKWHIAVPSALAVCGLAVALPSIAVQAFPETYRKTPVPFDAISVANGATLFTANCVPCHGPQAMGNGVLAKTLPKKPVDLLTEPHTAMHTAGDFFHWLTYGILEFGMPAWGDKLSEEDRWDLVNFLHAISRGYQSRLINFYVAPNQPYVVPQNFSYSAHDGASGTLKDFRRKKSVLLTLFSWPESRERLDQLKQSYSALNNSTMVLAVPINDLNQQDMAALTANLPFPVVTQGAPEIARSYALFRRTLSNPDLAGEGTIPKHMEFLIDRYGFLRARWIPAVDGAGWTDTNLLMQQIEQLNRENEIRPPPDDHVH
jgi:putative copper resistance protein D